MYPIVKPTEFTAPILDADFTGTDLKEEALDLVVDYCKQNGFWLLKKPKVRISHIKQVAEISAYIVKKGDPVW